MVYELYLNITVFKKNMNKEFKMFWDPRIKKEHE